MRILLPLDGSDFAESALATTVALASRWQAELVLLRVTSPILARAPDLLSTLGSEFAEQTRVAAEHYLKGVADRLDGLTVSFQCVFGSAKESISHEANESSSDLIVMASHGRTGLSRCLMGSTAEYVLRHSTSPVLLLRPRANPSAGRAYSHVLVPVDGSAAAREVVQRVNPYLAPGARVTVLRASGLTARDYTLLNSPDEVTDYLRHLKALIRELAVPGHEMEHVVLDGEAAHTILQYVDRHGCDLVAMSTHGRTGFRRFLLGSVTETVARHAACPVLAFPQHYRVP